MSNIDLFGPSFLQLERGQQRSVLEALIFASEEALSIKALYGLLVDSDSADTDLPQTGASLLSAESASAEDSSSFDAAHTEESAGLSSRAETSELPTQKKTMKKQNGIDEQAIALLQTLIDELNEEFSSTGRAFRIVRVAGGYQFATIAEHGEIVARLVKAKSKRRLTQAALETLSIIAYRQPISKPEVETIRGVNSGEMINRLMEKNLITITGRSEAIGKPLLYGTTEEFLRAFGLHSLTDLPKPREIEELIASQEGDTDREKTIMVQPSANADDIERQLTPLRLPVAEQTVQHEENIISVENLSNM